MKFTKNATHKKQVQATKVKQLKKGKLSKAAMLKVKGGHSGANNRYADW